MVCRGVVVRGKCLRSCRGGTYKEVRQRGQIRTSTRALLGPMQSDEQIDECDITKHAESAYSRTSRTSISMLRVSLYPIHRSSRRHIYTWYYVRHSLLQQPGMLFYVSPMLLIVRTESSFSVQFPIVRRVIFFSQFPLYTIIK